MNIAPHIAKRPFSAHPEKFVAAILRTNDGRVRMDYIIDGRTGNDALFDSRADAARALRPLLKAAVKDEPLRAVRQRVSEATDPAAGPFSICICPRLV